MRLTTTDPQAKATWHVAPFLLVVDDVEQHDGVGVVLDRHEFMERCLQSRASSKRGTSTFKRSRSKVAADRVRRDEPPATVVADPIARDDNAYAASWRGELELTPQQLKAMTEDEICPKCGKKEEMQGYDGGTDGDSATWFECSCGAFVGL
jgi:hypothetical protein